MLRIRQGCPLSVRGLETGVRNGKDQPASWFENPSYALKGGLKISNIDQRHDTDTAGKLTVAKLLSAFRKLLEGGASLLVIEHNLEVIKSADWLIDMGPEGGDQGGKIIASGTPEQVARNTQSHTGHFLARVLNGNGQAKRPANEASKSAGPAAPISDGAKIPPA